MKTGNLSLTYLTDGWMTLSIVGAAFYSCLMILILTLLVHAMIIASRSEVLHSYMEGNFDKIEEVTFQIKKGLALTQLGESEPCSEADLTYLREIKHTYYYLGDLGRSLDNKIICSVESGRLSIPSELPPVHASDPDGVEYRNSQIDLFQSKKTQPIMTYKNAVLFLSPAYLRITKHGYYDADGMSGVNYFNGDNRYVFSYFGGVLPDDLEHIIAYENSFWDWLPVPNKIRSKTRCSKGYPVCMTAAYQKIGLYGLSEKHLSIILLIILIVSIGMGVLIEYFRVGPRALLRKLKLEVRHDRIFPVYQPQVNIDTQEIIGFESLARWNDPSLGEVSPDIFISLAEDFNLIETLTQKLTVKIFRELHEILEKNSSLTISINISSELLTSDTFVKFLNQLTSQYGFQRKQVVLEVTERTVSNKDKMAAFSKRLKQQGYLVSIDDFGTGVSNLSWLSTLEPNEIKVDKLFTQSIDTETVNSITLDGIFGMLEHLKVKVVFEGVETEDQRDYIRNKIPDAIGQGWLFAKPQKIEDLKILLN